eukprot:scaffold4409_cov369-Prasinococcus_capsulatus_cf.AAC.37
MAIRRTLAERAPRVQPVEAVDSEDLGDHRLGGYLGTLGICLGILPGNRRRLQGGGGAPSSMLLPRPGARFPRGAGARGASRGGAQWERRLRLRRRRTQAHPSASGLAAPHRRPSRRGKLAGERGGAHHRSPCTWGARPSRPLSDGARPPSTCERRCLLQRGRLASMGILRGAAAVSQVSQGIYSLSSIAVGPGCARTDSEVS